MKKMKLFTWSIVISLLFCSQVFASGDTFAKEEKNEIETGVKKMIESFVEEYDTIANTPGEDGKNLREFFVTEQTDESILAFEQCYISAMEKQYYVSIKPDLVQENLLRKYEYSVITDSTNTMIHFNVNVVRTWNYAQTSNIDSESSDIYNIWVVKEDALWKILNVEGVLDDFQKERMSSVDIDCNKVNDLALYNENLKEHVVSFLDDFKVYDMQNSKACALEQSKSGQSVEPLATAYNRTAAVNYAFQYATTPNSAYTNFSRDCTNFISQCLLAGGISMHTGGAKYGWDSWYYKNGSDYSSAWTVADAFHNYLSYSVCQINNSITDYYGCSLGDIIQLYKVGSTSEVGHSTIITGFTYPSGGTDRGDIYVCCHTPNRKNVNFFQTWSGRGFVYHKISGRK